MRSDLYMGIIGRKYIGFYWGGREGRGGKGREVKKREVKKREGRGREWKGMEGKGGNGGKIRSLLRGLT